jgi:hypothetical protein
MSTQRRLSAPAPSRVLLFTMVLGSLACGPPPSVPTSHAAFDVYGAGAAPRVALADLDGDHRADLVVVFDGESEGDAGIIVRRGVGDGTFGPPRRVLVGRVSFDVADVDGNGRADIVVDDGWNLGVLDGGEGPMRVVAHVHGGRLLSARAAGAVTLEDDASLALHGWTEAAPEDEPTRVDPSPLVPLAMGDVDGDGARELVGITLGALGTRRNVPFAPVRLLEAPASSEVLVADVDGDGADDVVSWGHALLTVAGRTGRVAALAIPKDVTAVAVADLDGDARPDLVLASPHTVVLRCGSSLGAPAFAPCGNARGPWADPRGLALADLDGDGRAEIVIADRATSTVTVVRGL